MILSRNRSWIFLLFVALFGITASTVLFFAFGYRYSFERGIFIFSGSITVKTIPETVDIDIDGERIPKKRLGLLNNSIHVTGLMPGEHTIHISAPGYLPWEKRVIVESGVSREFWNVILPHDLYPADVFTATDTTTRAYPHPSNTNLLALAKQTTDEVSITLLNTETHEARQVFSLPHSTLDIHGDENIEWSWFENGRFILAPLIVQGALQHLVIDTTTGNFFTIEDRTGLGAIANVRWETKRTNQVIFVANSVLYRLSFEGENPLEFVSDQVVAYTLSNSNLFLITANGEVWQEKSDRLVTINQGLVLPAQNTPLRFTMYDEKRFAVLEESGNKRLFLFYPQANTGTLTFKEVGQMIEGMQFSDDGKKLLFFGNNEIGVIFANEWEVQPRRKAGEIVQVARFSEPIANVSWAENYEHIVFSVGQTVKFIELDGRDQRFIGNLQTLPAAPSQILPLFAVNRLYFIVPGYDITSIVFPEPQGLFGQ